MGCFISTAGPFSLSTSSVGTWVETVIYLIKWLMAGVYDEDLHENPFFKTLVEKHRQLFARAEECRWTVSQRGRKTSV